MKTDPKSKFICRIERSTFPLLVIHDNCIFPVGTTFCVSTMGSMLFAAHSAAEALKRGYSVNDSSRIYDESTRGSILRDSTISAFIAREGHLSAYPMTMWNHANPSDLMIGTLKEASSAPVVALPISFKAPKIGEKVYLVGCPNLNGGEHGIPLDSMSVTTGANLVGNNIELTEAVVTNVFVQRFARGFVDGPCFTVDANSAHGKSGGPVINAEGFACGLISAGAGTLFGTPGSIVSLLFPIMHDKLKIDVGGSPLNEETHSLCLREMIGQGCVTTDGSESEIESRSIEGVNAAGIVVSEKDATRYFDDFSGYQEGKPCTLEYERM